jgi:hypothetical protein
MTKIIKDSHKVGEEGVLLFNKYCNQHKPFIIFREVTKHDFGIDGEMELTRTNENNKTEALGEILKVQIKSVNSDNSYIQGETEEEFTYYASKDDMDYWLKHQKYGLPVIIIIADLRNGSNKLYAKIISDQLIPKSTKKISSLPVPFNKASNLLDFQKNDFVEKFSAEFKTRVNFDVEEFLVSNALRVKTFPRSIYKYKAKFKTKKTIFEKIKNADAPHFVVKGEDLYTFREIKDCKEFCKEILDDSNPSTIHFQNIKISLDLTNIFLELFYEHIKHDLRGKKLYYSKDYHRYYFHLKESEDLLEVDTKTRRRDTEKKKKVVTYHEYGRTKKIVFFRHLAVELKIKLIDDGFWIIVNPKYLFTKDRKEPLEPKLITRYTNYLTAREFNDVYLNNLHFWKTYLFKGAKEWEIYANNKTNIIITEYHEEKVKFGVALDTKKDRKKTKKVKTNTTESLFENED